MDFHLSERLDLPLILKEGFVKFSLQITTYAKCSERGFLLSCDESIFRVVKFCNNRYIKDKDNQSFNEQKAKCLQV